MKKFEIPELEIVKFNQKDIIITSTCECVECPECPEQDSCPYKDWT